MHSENKHESVKIRKHFRNICPPYGCCDIKNGNRNTEYRGYTCKNSKVLKRLNNKVYNIKICKNMDYLN